MARPGTWKKGESGNPNGRPPKNRALSEILERAGSQTLERDGKRLSGKRLIAVLLWELATTGTCTLPNGTVYTVDGAGWFDVVKFLYAQIDGPPKVTTEVTGKDGNDLIIRVVYDRDSSTPSETA